MTDHKMDKIKDRDDLRNLFLTYSDELYKFAYTRLGYKKEVAEDVIQDLFIKVWDNKEKYDPALGSIRTWLYAILRNMIIDTYRKGKFKLVEMKDDKSDLREVENIDDEFLIESYLRKLGPKEYELLLLRYQQDLEISEIAKIVGKNQNSVRVSIHRAIKRLKNLIENDNG